MKLLLTAALAGSAAAFAPSVSNARSATALNVAAGDKLPSAKLFQGFPDPETIDIAEYAKGKNMIIVGLPGAFTPT